MSAPIGPPGSIGGATLGFANASAAPVPQVPSPDPHQAPSTHGAAAPGAAPTVPGGMTFPVRPAMLDTPLHNATLAPAKGPLPAVTSSSSSSPLLSPHPSPPAPGLAAPLVPPGPVSNPPLFSAPIPAPTGPLFPPPPGTAAVGPAKGAPTLFTSMQANAPIPAPGIFTPSAPAGPVTAGPPKGPLFTPTVPSLGAPPLGPPPLGPTTASAPGGMTPAAAALLAPPTGPVFLTPHLAPPSSSPSATPSILTPSNAPPSRGPLGPPPMGPTALHPVVPPPGTPHMTSVTPNPPSVPTPTAPLAAGPGNAAGGRVKIEQSQMPSPMALHSNAIVEYKTRSHGGVPPPPSVLRYFATDEGNSSPHFLRFSQYQIPTTNSLQNQSCLPFGALLTPFAEDLHPEEHVELVNDFKEKGPLRCVRCKAYPSPYWVWLDGGKSFRCNICDSVNDTPQEYYAPTDHNGLRTDIHLRPELRYGTVEFAVGPEYFHKKERAPAPLSMLFLVEVTAQSVRAGVLNSFCAAMKALLPTIPKKTRIGIATFDAAVHYYALQKGQTQPHMLVMADHTAGFLPASRDSFLVPFDDDHRPIVETLLTKLPAIWNNNGVTNSATGAALQSAILALRSSGGRIVLVQSSMPSLGAGALKPRFDPKMLGTEKELLLFSPPEQNNFWADLGSKCSEMKICVDTVLMSDASIDLPTQQALARSTCGQYFWMGPPKGSQRDEIAFTGVLHRILHRTTAQDALLRIRCSKGLTVNEFLCNYHQSAYHDEADLGGVDGDKTIAFTIKHEEELPDKKEATFQVALLYTTKEGERRARIFNASLPVTTSLPVVFRLADLDATLVLMARQAVMHFLKEKSLTKLRTHVTDATIALLGSYRKYCSATSSAGQLILPEALKLIPAYILGLLKHAVFRPSIDTLPDERFYWVTYLMNEGPSTIMNLLYPRLYALHRIPPNCGLPAEGGGAVMLPPPLRLAQESIEAFGAYLVADDSKLVIFIARGASEDLLKDAFGVPTVDHVDPRVHVLPEVDTDINRRIQAIISELRRSRLGLYPSLHFVRQRDPLEVRLFASSLVEEKITAGDPFNYVDWLCYLHKEIMNKLSHEQRAAATLENFNLFN